MDGINEKLLFGHLMRVKAAQLKLQYLQFIRKVVIPSAILQPTHTQYTMLDEKKKTEGVGAAS